MPGSIARYSFLDMLVYNLKLIIIQYCDLSLNYERTAVSYSCSYTFYIAERDCKLNKQKIVDTMFVEYCCL